ncbi:MAG TPA: enoyl-CoA hydratase-related protein [Streptosporangiaceae bacterium]|nr:enoyl-CoA hydratase-related protein [Streptosporangiaceae bacterium]
MEAQEQLVRTKADGAVTTITLDSPRNANALSSRLLSELLAALDSAVSGQATRVIVLTAVGKAFCAGADLKETAVNPTAAAPLMADVLQALWDCPKPVVCRVNGAARAGGIGLIAACDIAVAPEDVSFAFSEVRIGVVPAVISVPCLRRMPSRAAYEYFLTGEVFQARRAVEIGLLTKAVEAEFLDAATSRYVQALLRGGPTALAGTKEVLRDGITESFSGGVERMSRLSAAFFASEEAAEGRAAFAAKREPSWVPAS